MRMKEEEEEEEKQNKKKINSFPEHSSKWLNMFQFRISNLKLSL